jgi:hypothetical protein
MPSPYFQEKQNVKLSPARAMADAVILLAKEPVLVMYQATHAWHRNQLHRQKIVAKGNPLPQIQERSRGDADD